jgi:hypothetical protein
MLDRRFAKGRRGKSENITYTGLTNTPSVTFLLRLRFPRNNSDYIYIKKYYMIHN